MKNELRPKKLNRFISIPRLIDILVTKKLAFSDPERWEDKNDSCLLEIYKKRKKASRICAICFLGDEETIHHWDAFASEGDGCCIEFGVNEMLDLIEAAKKEFPYAKIMHGKVNYKKIRKVNGKIPDDSVPFYKRNLYACEAEYRVLLTANDNKKPFAIDLGDLSVIKKITLSGKLEKSSAYYALLRDTLVKLANFKDCKKVNPSSVYFNEKWIAKFS